MHKEMESMTNEEMFTAIIERMDSMESGLSGLTDKVESGLTGLSGRMDKVESGLTGLSGRMDKVESGLTGLTERIDKLESNMDMEFRAVRIEMDVVNKSLKEDISILNDKVDRLMYTKDVDGYEKMKIQVNLLTKGYQELKEKMG